MVRAQTLKPTLTLSKICAFTIALSIYAIIVWLALTGVFGILNSFPNLVAVFGSVMLLLLAILARPHIPKFPKEYETARDYPHFFALMEKIADAMNTRNVSAVVFDWDFNAAFGQLGWRRRPVLWLGVPLFTSLAPQERIALLAHELAHGVNGDPNRGFFVGTALRSLSMWYVTLRVENIEVESIPGTIANLLMRIAAFVPLALWIVLAHLIWRDSQRAEYLADYLASQLSGTDAQIGLLQKLRHADRYFELAKEIALQPNERDLYGELAHHITAIPEADAAPNDPLEEYDLDSTHPPRAYRIEFLQAHRVAQPALEISQAEWDAVDAELAPVRRAMQEKILERYKGSLYY